jgi:hypothetical protein
LIKVRTLEDSFIAYDLGKNYEGYGNPNLYGNKEVLYPLPYNENRKIQCD